MKQLAIPLRAAISGLMLFFSSTIYAQDVASGPPAIELPGKLSSYGDVSKVITAVEQAISILATANFVRSKQTIASQCNKPEFLAVYRGLLMVHAAHRMTINKIELGWVSTNSVLQPKDDPDRPRAILRPSRLALLAVWQQKEISRLMKLSNSLSKLPDNARTDLHRFFLLLQSSQTWYEQIRKRTPKKLAKLERTFREGYWAERENAENYKKEHPESYDYGTRFNEQWPKYVYYDELSKKYRTMINATRDLGQPKLNKCLDGEAAFLGKKWKELKSIYKEISFGPDKQFKLLVATVSPLKYSMRFWERRYKEGTTALAKYAIALALQALQ